MVRYIIDGANERRAINPSHAILLHNRGEGCGWHLAILPPGEYRIPENVWLVKILLAIRPVEIRLSDSGCRIMEEGAEWELHDAAEPGPLRVKVEHCDAVIIYRSGTELNNPRLYRQVKIVTDPLTGTSEEIEVPKLSIFFAELILPPFLKKDPEGEEKRTGILLMPESAETMSPLDDVYSAKLLFTQGLVISYPPDSDDYEEAKRINVGETAMFLKQEDSTGEAEICPPRFYLFSEAVFWVFRQRVPF